MIQLTCVILYFLAAGIIARILRHFITPENAPLAIVAGIFWPISAGIVLVGILFLLGSAIAGRLAKIIFRRQGTDEG